MFIILPPTKSAIPVFFTITLIIYLNPVVHSLITSKTICGVCVGICVGEHYVRERDCGQGDHFCHESY